jgi:4-hydroxy-4-methyl-2-oxoglutarate aldolase
MLGYAVTGRIRTSEPPMKGSCYYDRMDWWSYLASLPEPRVMVIEDVDDPPGVGAFVGEIHAAIGKALNCVGCVTNGAVRDLVSVKALGFSLFAGSVAVSHSYAHIIDFGGPVEVGGLIIRPGELIHGDRHGVHVIPLEIAEDVPGVARRIQDEERELMGFCRSRDFSLQELSLRMQSISKDGQPSPSLITVPTPTK